MKTRFTVGAALVAFLIVAGPSLRGAGTDPGNMILHAHSVIMAGSASSEALKDALIEVLDAALLILPKTGADAECRSRIEVARREFDEKSVFSDKGYQYLSLAYRLMTDGIKWRIPDALSAAYKSADIMAAAKKAGQEKIDAALAGLKGGRDTEAVRNLLDYVLMVVTPVEH